MIRGKAITLTIILACIFACESNKFESIHLSNVERSINLAGPYPTETAKLTIHADDDQISHFSYLVPLEYDSKINRLSFFKNNKDKSSLTYTRAVYIYVQCYLVRMEDLLHIIESSCHIILTSMNRLTLELSLCILIDMSTFPKALA